MGKNLKGKECGKGIRQRKDGLYSARFVDKYGNRHEKYFATVPEARNRIEDSKYADKHEGVFVPTETTVDEWFEFWIENIVGDLAPNTLRNYRERYFKAHIRYPCYRGGDATESITKTTRSRQYQNNDGPICSCHYRFYGPGY